MRQPFATIFVLASALGLLAGCQTHRAAPAPAVMPATSIELRTPRPGLYTAGQPAADDWAAIAADHPEYLLDDLVHHNAEGAEAYRELIVGASKRCVATTPGR